MRINQLMFVCVLVAGLVEANERVARYLPAYQNHDNAHFYPNRNYDHGYQNANNYYPPRKYNIIPNATFNYYVTWIPVSVNYTNATLNASNYDYFVECSNNYECANGLKCIEGRCRCYGNQRYSYKYRKCVPCPKGWVMYENLCYYISNHRRTWYDAKNYCEYQSSRLMTIDTRVMIDFSYEFFDKFYLKDYFHVGAFGSKENKWYWFSGHRIPAGGPWWSKCFIPTNYYGNYYHYSESCGKLSKYGLGSTSCNSVRERFICETDFEFDSRSRIDHEIRRYNYEDTLKLKKRWINPHDFEEKIDGPYAPKSIKIKDDDYLNMRDYQPKSYGSNYGTYLSQCKYSSQCIYGLECIKNKCCCPYYYYWSWKSKQCIKCPKGFVYFEGHCYYIARHPANFTLANQICKNYYSHLLVIKTRVIIDFLHEFFSKFYLRGKYWLGGLSTNYTSYWLDGCLIEKGPWWNHCNPTYYQKNATLNQTQCIATDGYGLEKLDCSIPYPFICQYGKKKIFYIRRLITSTSTSTTDSTSSSTSSSTTTT